jgi:hypothetical protein
MKMISSVSLVSKGIRINAIECPDIHKLLFQIFQINFKMKIFPKAISNKEVFKIKTFLSLMAYCKTRIMLIKIIVLEK